MHTGYSHYAGDMLRWRLLFDFITGLQNVRGMGIIHLFLGFEMLGPLFILFFFELRAESDQSVLDGRQMC